MPGDERFTQFLNLLKTATEQQRLRWARTPDPSEYRARLPIQFLDRFSLC